MWTTIRISRRSLDRFNELGKRGESQEDIMVRMLDSLEGRAPGEGVCPSCKEVFDDSS